MALQLLRESPASPASSLGPYRFRDYLAAPDEPRVELLFGRFYASPSSSPRRQAVTILLWQYLQAAARPAGGWVFAAPLDVVLADHSVAQPDVLIVASEGRETIQDRIKEAPQLVVEVLSPGTARRDRGEKLKLYAESGVEEYWLVDLATRQIELLVNGDGAFTVALPLDGCYRSAMLPDLSFDLEAFWAEVEGLLPGRLS
jgi:Uma2 family endonuclease